MAILRTISLLIPSFRKYFLVILATLPALLKSSPLTSNRSGFFIILLIKLSEIWVFFISLSSTFSAIDWTTTNNLFKISLRVIIPTIFRLFEDSVTGSRPTLNFSNLLIAETTEKFCGTVITSLLI